MQGYLYTITLVQAARQPTAGAVLVGSQTEGDSVEQSAAMPIGETASMARSNAVTDSMAARTVMITGDRGDEIQAYLASPGGDRPRGGVVVIHHMPGYDRATKEITRRFAELGYDTVCPNLYWREAPGAAPDDAAATARANGGVPDPRLVGDIGGGAAYLRALSSSNGKVGVIGYCSGGRQAVLAACSLDLDAAVDCYGGFVFGTPPERFPGRSSLVDILPDLRCPLLGLFGKLDSAPSPDDVARLGKIFEEHSKQFEFHSYDNAGHGFFATDRSSYEVAAAKAGWERISEFFATYLES
jgi:carboxymethylenebutenolidase